MTPEENAERQDESECSKMGNGDRENFGYCHCPCSRTVPAVSKYFK